MLLLLQSKNRSCEFEHSLSILSRLDFEYTFHSTYLACKVLCLHDVICDSCSILISVHFNCLDVFCIYIGDSSFASPMCNSILFCLHPPVSVAIAANISCAFCSVFFVCRSAVRRGMWCAPRRGFWTVASSVCFLVSVRWYA